MKIRPKRIADYKSIVDIAKSLPKWFTKNGIRQIKYATRKQQGLVVTEENQIVGFVFYRKWQRTSYLTWMGVMSNKRRKGIGSKLLSALETELKKSRIYEIKVSTLARTVKYIPYEETRFFYKINGFVLHCIDKDFYPKGGDREILIKKFGGERNARKRNENR